MGCLCCKAPDKGEIFKPRRKRWCTDILCLLLFIAAWIYLIVLTVVSINKDPSLIDDLLYPADSYGNNCGKPGSEASAYDKVIYPKLDQDIIDQYDKLATGRYWSFRPTRYCATSCPGLFSLKSPQKYGGTSYPMEDANRSTPEELYYPYKTQDVLHRCFPLDLSTTYTTTELCVEPACTDTALNASLSGSVHCFSVESQPDATNVWRICDTGTADALCEDQRTKCTLRVDMDKTETFMPQTQTDTSNKYTQLYAQYVSEFIGAVEGLLVAEGRNTILVLGLGLPILMAFVWAILLWAFAGFVVFLLLFVLLVGSALGCAYLGSKAGWYDAAAIVGTVTNANNTAVDILEKAKGDEKDFYTACAIVAIILTVLLWISILLSLKQILRLVAVLRECTKIFKDMFSIVLWPLLGFIFQAAVFVYGLLAFYFLFYVWDDSEQWVKWAIWLSHLFGILWSIQFIRACCWTSLSGAVCYWFVTLNAPKAKKLGFCPHMGFGIVLDSTITVIAKHLGSMAFGSCVITVVWFLQLMLRAIDYLTKKQQAKSMILKFTLKCLQCCMWCLRKTVEFISYYGFVFVALEGMSFCVACKETFVFVLKNPVQTSVNKMVQHLLRMLIGLTTPVICAVAAFYYLENETSYSDDYKPLYTALVVFVVAYIVTDGVCLIFDAAIDTIYISAFKDMAENDPPKFMSNDLRRGFGLSKAKEDKSAAKDKDAKVKPSSGESASDASFNPPPSPPGGSSLVRP